MSGAAQVAKKTGIAFTTLTPTSLASASGLADLIGRPAPDQELILETRGCQPAASLLRAAGRHHGTMTSRMQMMCQILAHLRRHRRRQLLKLLSAPLAAPASRISVQTTLSTRCVAFGIETKRTQQQANETAKDDDNHEQFGHHAPSKELRSTSEPNLTGPVGILATPVVHFGPLMTELPVGRFASCICDGGTPPRRTWSASCVQQACRTQSWLRYLVSWTLAVSAACGRGLHHTPRQPHDLRQSLTKSCSTTWSSSTPR